MTYYITSNLRQLLNEHDMMDIFLRLMEYSQNNKHLRELKKYDHNAIVSLLTDKAMSDYITVRDLCVHQNHDFDRSATGITKYIFEASRGNFSTDEPDEPEGHTDFTVEPEKPEKQHVKPETTTKQVIESYLEHLAKVIIENNSADRIQKVLDLGLLFDEETAKVRGTNAGKSDYATKLIQPWAIFQENPQLLYQEADIIKRILRTKEEGGMTPTEARLLDIQKIIHNAKELERIYTIKLRKEREGKQ